MRDTSRDGQAFQMELVTCRMTLIDGYVVEGHVSAPVIKRLLAERPAIKGLSLPGMPVCSPVMEGRRTRPLVNSTFGDSGESLVFVIG